MTFIAPNYLQYVISHDISHLMRVIERRFQYFLLTIFFGAPSTRRKQRCITCEQRLVSLGRPSESGRSFFAWPRSLGLFVVIAFTYITF